MLGEPLSKRPIEQVGGGGVNDAGTGREGQEAAVGEGDARAGAAVTAGADTAAEDSGGDANLAVNASWSWERVRERFGSRPEFQAIALERCAFHLCQRLALLPLIFIPIRVAATEIDRQIILYYIAVRLTVQRPHSAVQGMARWASCRLICPRSIYRRRLFRGGAFCHHRQSSTPGRLSGLG